jgi:hypothetical protein
MTAEVVEIEYQDNNKDMAGEMQSGKKGQVMGHDMAEYRQT